MDPSEQLCLLDSHTPAAVIEIFSGLADATGDLVELIKATPHQYLRKLRTVFLSVENYDMEAVIALCQSSNRQHRYAATYLVLSQIKAECKKKANFDRIAHLYDSVFTVRFRDVDPLIRGMTVQFVSEFIADNPVLRKMAYLKYVGWALNDRNDCVRRRALRSIAKLAAAYGRARKRDDNMHKENIGNRGRGAALSDDFEAFFRKYKDRLVEMACFDTNANLQKDAATTVLHLHVIAQMFSEDDMGKVLNVDQTTASDKQKAMEALLPDGIWNMERIHELYKHIGAEAFRSWRLSTADLESFVLNISLFIKEHSTCCDSPFICYLEVLRMLEISADPSIFIPLLETTRDSSANTAKVVQCISNTASPKEFASSMAEVVSMLQPVATEDAAVFGHFVQLLRRLEQDLGVLVNDVLSNLRSSFREEYFLPLIKNFDISDLLPPTAKSVEKCYAALWLVTRCDYFHIEMLEFTDAEELGVLIDFLVVFHEYAGISESTTLEDREGPAQTITDSRSAFIRLYCKLHGLISRNLHFEDEESCLHLFKMIDRNIFPEAADTVYRICKNDTLIQLISMARHPRPMVAGFLKTVGSDRRLHALAKQVAGRADQNDRDRYVFGWLKELVAQRQLLDTVLFHFIPVLTVNECIVLENMASKSKFKAACARFCRTRATPNTEKRATII